MREREEHAERHAKRRMHTVEAGVWRQHQLPRGLAFVGQPGEDGRVSGKDRRLTPGPDAEEVRQAFKDRAAGTPVLELAERLGMTTSGVRAMLANRVYLGELRDGDYVNPNAHEPLVDEELFRAVNRSDTPRPARRKAGGPPALLAGLIRCEACGHVMPRSSSGGTVVYTCSRHHSGAWCPAPAAITGAKVDEHVERIAIAELASIRVTASEGQRVEQARAALDEAEAELRAYLSAVSAADVGVGVFREGATQRREAVDAARAELDSAIRARPVLPAALDGDQAWGKLEVQGRNLVLRGLIAAVVVRRAGRGRRVAVADRVRVVRAGAGVAVPERRRGTAMGLHPLAFDDFGAPDLLGEPSSEGTFKRAGG